MRKPFTNLVGVCCSFLFLLTFSTQEANAQYCGSASGNTAFEWLSNVEFAGINNPSTSTAYSDFTAISGTVNRGLSFDFTGTVSQATDAPETIVVYIDWDQSESFESSRTQIGNSCSGNCSLTGAVEGTVNALLGETRMRVILQYNTAATNPCGDFLFGEVEDYTIDVQEGTCTPPNFTFNASSDCIANNYDVTAFLANFGSSTSITIYLTRSDAVPVNPVNLISLLT